MTDHEAQERRAWLAFYGGPASGANRVAVNVVSGGSVRVSFAEQYDEQADPAYRAAVLLSDFTAYELWKILGQMEPVKHHISQAENAAVSDPVGEQ